MVGRQWCLVPVRLVAFDAPVPSVGIQRGERFAVPQLVYPFVQYKYLVSAIHAFGVELAGIDAEP